MRTMDKIQAKGMKDKGLFDLTNEQQKAFNRLERAYKDCLESGVFFVNHHGSLQAYDCELICGYGDHKFHAPGVSEASIDDIGETSNSIKIPGEWADDEHYFGLTEKGNAKYFGKR